MRRIQIRVAQKFPNSEALKSGFRSLAQLTCSECEQLKFKPKRTAAASRSFLATARLSCCMAHSLYSKGEGGFRIQIGHCSHFPFTFPLRLRRSHLSRPFPKLFPSPLPRSPSAARGSGSAVSLTLQNLRLSFRWNICSGGSRSSTGEGKGAAPQ